MLTASFCNRIKPSSKVKRYADKTGNGLLLVVQPSGSKSWIQRVKVQGRYRDFGLGSFPLISLSDARTKAWANKKTISQGIDPTVNKAPTVAKLAERFIEIHSPSWSKGTLSAWRTTLDVHILPALGQKRADQVTVDDCLTLILSKSNGTRQSVRQRLSSILDTAVARRLIDFNPAGDALTSLIPKESAEERQPKHFDAMPYADVPAFLGKVRAGRQSTANLCLQLLILTGVRQSEARGAEWSEIDLGNAVWVIPGERMKSRREHVVPLPDRAIEILQALPKTSPLVFPNRKGAKPISGTTLTQTLRKYEDKFTLHGFRSSFRDWAAENDVPGDVAEACLAHQNKNKIEACYKRTDFLAKRAKVMQTWADFLK